MIEERNISQLPKGWELKKLVELAKFIDYRGRTPQKTMSGIPLITAKNVKMGYINEDPKEFIAEEDYEKWMTRGFPKIGDILFTTEAPLGNVAQLKNNARIALAQRMITFQTFDLIENLFLKYGLMSPQFQQLLNREGTGTTVKGIKAAVLKQLQIPLPPKPGQFAIVSKIEELFSEIEKGIESLFTAKQQLKTYRQSVLKWAFEGKLSDEWRKEACVRIPAVQLIQNIAAEPEAEYKTKKKSQNHTNDSSNKGLPQGWKWVQIKDVAETYGGYAFKSGEFTREGKYQVLRMGNIRPGILRYDESPVFLDDVNENVLSRSLLQINDVIITQTGTRKKRDYGFTVLIPKTNLLLNQRIAALRFKQRFLPKFFLYFSWTDLFKDQFFANETGNVGQGNVGMKAVTETLVPFCSIKEQSLIVQTIESRLSVADKMEESITQSLQQAEALKQSILKKAFEGKLVKF